MDVASRISGAQTMRVSGTDPSAIFLSHEIADEIERVEPTMSVNTTVAAPYRPGERGWIKAKNKMTARFGEELAGATAARGGSGAARTGR
jgi:hypothetical protein